MSNANVPKLFPGDAVHGEESDGRHSGGTDLDDDGRDVRPHGMRDVADEAHRGRADQEAPEEPDSTTVGPLGYVGLGGQRSPLPPVRSYVTVCSPTSTDILASTPSPERYDARVPQLQTSPVIYGDEFPLLERLFGPPVPSGEFSMTTAVRFAKRADGYGVEFGLPQ